MTFLNTGAEIRCLIVQLLLILTLPSEHLIEVCELISEILLELVLQGLLLKLDVSQTTLLLRFLCALILIQRLLVSIGFVIADILISDQLPPELALLVSHLCAEIDLLRGMLLLKFLSEG